jgi:hypothetical protein
MIKYRITIEGEAERLVLVQLLQSTIHKELARSGIMVSKFDIEEDNGSD